MTYRWNSDHLGSVLALPAAVVDSHIRLAGSAQLKVLLWLARRGDGIFDAAACSQAIGLSAADCADALQYWIECGVLEQAGGVRHTPKAEPASAPVVPVVNKTAASTTAPANTPAYLPTARPHAVKPQMREVIARQKESPEFDYLLQTASARLGRPISHGDMETLLYLYETAGLPAEVILMIIVYAVSAEKGNMRYIERMALDWADRGINTIAAAEEHLCRQERRKEAWERLSALLGLTQRPTTAQLDAAELWLCEWRMHEGLIRMAYDQCVERTGKFQSNYMARILEHWRLDGVETPEQAEAARAPRSAPTKAAGKPLPSDRSASSLDIDEYEQLVRQYRPVYKKQEEA